MKATSILNLTPVKFVIAVGGIYTSYIYFGLVMERLFSTDYSGLNRPKGQYERFSFGFATSLFQNLFSFILAACVNRFYYGQKASRMDLKSELTIGFCSFGSVFMASQALAYVSFPIQAIMKSSKIISILIVSFLLGVKGQHTKSQYFCGVIITTGIVIFNLTEGKSKKGDTDTSVIGIVAILISLFCDGYLGTTQGEIKKKFNPNQWDQMESLNKWAGLVCLTVANVSFQMGGFIKFVLDNPLVIKDLVLLAVLGTFGQVFIFYTIANFSPLILSIVTTTRKFFTVLASILMYHHEVNIYQWMAIGLVFAGVFIEMMSGSKKHGKSDHVPLPTTVDDVEAKVIGKEEDVTRRGGKAA
jgi:UDP-galactose transporter B1